MFCSNCGYKIKKGSKFCYKCGAEIKNVDTELLNQVDTEKINMYTEPLVNEEVCKVSKTTSSREKKLINMKIVGIFFCVVVLATLIYLIYPEVKKVSFYQQNKPTKQAKINITQVNTDNFPLIKVYFSVLDENNNVISGLNPKYFKLGEKIGSNGENTNQIISDLKLPNGNESLNLNLVMDVSDSMTGSKIQQAKDAADNFLKMVNYKSGDKIEIISFSDSVNINGTFSSDENTLKNCIDGLSTGSATAFYDSLYTALMETNKQNGHKCIIAFTDGKDNRSHYNKGDIINLSKKLSIPIYVIGIGEDVNQVDLTDLAKETKGYYKFVSDINDIGNIYKDVFTNQKSQYMITYTSKNAQASSQWRDLIIDLNSGEYTSKVTVQFEPQSASDKLVVANMERDIRNLLSTEKGDYSVAYQDLKNDNTMYINSKKMRAASVIKLYVMIEAFNQIKSGKLNGSYEITLTNSMKVGGTGILVNQNEGAKLSIDKLIELMIADSDNTAANMLIDKLGINSINNTINKLGCTDTVLQRKMMDIESIKQGVENYTSVRDLNLTFSKIYKNQCIDENYDKKMIEILKKQKNNSKIPGKLPESVQVAHKTGELDGVENDAGIVFTPNGDYVLSILNEGTVSDTAIKNDEEISKIVYDNHSKIGQ